MHWYHAIYVPVLNIPWNEDHTLIVDFLSNSKLKRVVEQFGYHLKREFHYDFPLYTVDENPCDEDYTDYEAHIF